MSDDDGSIFYSDEEPEVAPVASIAPPPPVEAPPPAKCSRTDNASTQKVISNLEKFVLSQNLDKSYKKIATDGISSSKRTLESLLARNGGHQNRLSEETAHLNNKNYTLDANGRVCLVKTSSKETSRQQEFQLLSLQKDTHELRCLREYLMLALESIMQNHRQMMVDYVKNVKETPRQVPKTAIDNAMKKAKTRMIEDFAQMALSVDESVALEEIQSENRRKLIKNIETETFLMRMMLEMEDIREANPKDLAEMWRNRKRPTSTKPTEPLNQAAGDGH